MRDVPRPKQPKELEMIPLGTPEYESDLRKRGGGLMAGRDADEARISEHEQAIIQGMYDEQDVQALIHRNPGAAPRFQSAIQQRDILQQRFQPARETRIGVPPAIAAPGVPTVPVEEMPVRKIPAKIDPTGAVTDLVRVGRFGEAQKIASLFGMGRAATPAKPITIANTIHPLTGEEGTVLVDPRSPDPANPRNILGFFPRSRSVYEPDVQKLGKDIDKSRITAVLPAIKELDTAVAEFDRTGELPGIGLLKNVKASDFVKTPEGKFIRASVQTLFNEELRQASGVAVTVYEQQRKDIQDALRVANTAADYVNVYKRLIRPRWSNIVSNILGKYHPKAIDLYNNRSGGRLDLIGIQRIPEELQPEPTRQKRPTTQPAKPEAGIVDFSQLPEG
jgi:hypothetical protein